MSMAEYLKNEYEQTLENRYQKLKTSLEDDGFTPDNEEVWKMYGTAFHENHGVYILAANLLELELYDESDRLNELCIILNNVNNRICDYCSAYVTGAGKNMNVEEA